MSKLANERYGKSRSRIIITTRPYVDVKMCCDYARYTISKMKLPQIAAFVKNWNKSILDASVSDEQIDMETETLMNIIRESGGLRSISSTPLLCAMLCTINYHSNGFVPTNGNQLLGLINQSEAARTVKFFQFESDSLGFISYSDLKNFSSVEELKLVLRNRELDYDLFSVSKLTNLKTISLILNEEVCWDIEGKLFDAEENNDSITWDVSC